MAKTRRSISAVVQTASLAGDDQTVQRILVETGVATRYRHFQDPSNQPDVFADEIRIRLSQRLGLHYAPTIWGYLRNANIGRALHNDSGVIDELGEEG